MLKTSTTVLWMGAAWGLALLGATQAVADPCHETGKCTASDAQFGDRFGDAVALDGDVAVMGTPDGDDYGSQSGSVYIFHYDGAVWA
ncbi:MAG: FG-GAP repeat protein, partial [Planctomycetota bacterium]